MLRCVQLWCALALGLVLLAGPARGEPRTVVITEEVQLHLGDAFMADGEYYRAVTEYLRYLYLFPGAERAPYALLQIGMAHFHGEEYQRAIDYFARVRVTYAPDYFSAAAYYEGLCYEHLNQPGKAQDAFEQAVAFNPAASPAREAVLGKALGQVRQGNLSGGRTEFHRFRELYPEDSRDGSVARAVEMIDAQAAAPRKSSLLAGTLSAIVPGSGQAYAGKYRDGLVSLLVNGLFIAGTVVAIDQENYATAAVVGGIGLPFYLGNIYGATHAASKWNVALHKDLRDRLAVTLDYRY
jgi:tetratricopeptide (TPR) repeat protein